MKKLGFIVLLIIIMIPSVFATAEREAASGYEVAMITDIGDIDDKSFNQGTWEGVEKFAMDNDLTHKYYKPTEKTTDAYVAAIDLAIQGGAKIIVTPGFLFEPAIFRAQDLYPDTSFILIDGFPQDGTYTEFRIESNVYSIFYAEQESGFLAGYAAVKDGYTKLGFMGGMAVPAVVRFGYGFVQGAEYAAQEMGIDAVILKYTYTGNFDATPENQALAASWFGGGTEVIFAAGGKVGNSVMAAAEANNGKVIGVDVDQSAESTSVISSAMKQLGISVYLGLEEYYAGNFKGGVSEVLDVTVDAVGLPMGNSKFNSFSQADYDEIFNMLVNDTAGVKSGIIGDGGMGGPDSAEALPVEIVSVTVVQ
ncbi:MAG: BMP family ABC transporter substrate-binding protein [Spirochaetales bacterium]|nr:BMP family ABC transporter substrate-binding protein [Spirochaetales bacterium]